MTSPAAVWTAYLWRLMVSMLAPSSALLPLGAWAASVWGSPVPELHLLQQQQQQQQQQLQQHQQSRVSTAGPYRDISEFNCFNASLPNITIYATGGTIAGSASSADQTTGYQAGALGVQALIDAVPQLCNVSNVRGVQVANTDSTNMNSTMLLALSQQMQDDLDSPYTQGAVVTHGTDTLEESAFFLDLMVQSDKPIVVTGSMRPATAISADGPMNLLSSVTVAGSENARGRGVMIVLNDRIGSARFMSKSNANQLDAFQSADGGFLGGFVNIQPVFYYPPSRPLGHHHFDVRRIRRWRGADAKLPQVDVLYAHQELNVGLFQAAIDLGAKGIVLAGLGAGYWTDSGSDEIRRALQDVDIPVVVSRRPGWGFASSNGIEGGIGAGFLNPQKARIQLQLALETGLETDAIRPIFEHHGVH
ncbi:Asparaginase/glutaminase [Dactylonectria estremocensis]|uniref:asparaginase n=1 Tax=Dactylonectria estremocensis TaxID=1079267 RepID=A0A9P9FK03_9HYPO|nr:Asparaginase/glutaminase [Dactylonectria estremocensis]